MDIFNLPDDEMMSSSVPPVTEEITNQQTTETEVPFDDNQNKKDIPQDNNEEVNNDPENNEEEQEEVLDPNEEQNQEHQQEVEDTPEAKLAKIFAPFNANGKEIKVDTVEDAIRLMQMGAGFNKKMSNLKPHLKTIKMLENNGIKDEATLSFLIDVHKKDPAAIAKLLADSGIDPLNLDTSTEYTPNTYAVNDSELELDNVLDSLKDSPHYHQTLDLVANKWDAQSKQLFVSNPHTIEIIHGHIQSGIYDQVIAKLERDRMFGKYQGVSDLEAYKAVGDEMEARKLFKPINPGTKTSTQTSQQKPAVNSDINDKKRAASPTKSTPGTGQKQEFNVLDLSDEEFNKLSSSKFI